MIAKVNIIIKKSFTNFLRRNLLRLYTCAGKNNHQKQSPILKDEIICVLTN